MVIRARRLFEADDIPPSPEGVAAWEPDPDQEARDEVVNSKAPDGVYSGITGGNNLFFRAERSYGYGGRTTRRGYRGKKIENNTYVLDMRYPGDNVGEGRKFGILLHNTIIAEITLDKATYRTNGYETRTTQDRINSWMTGGWRVYTHQFGFYWMNNSSTFNPHNLGFSLSFTDGDWIDNRTGELHAQAKPKVKGRRIRKISESKGLYADLSNGKPEYYVKCPECGNVDGMFSTIREAELNSLCGACRFDKHEKLKAQLEKDGVPKRR